MTELSQLYATMVEFISQIGPTKSHTGNHSKSSQLVEPSLVMYTELLVDEEELNELPKMLLNGVMYH
jgi:hypothetical protein